MKPLECAINMSVIKAFKDFVSTMPSPRIHISNYICLQMFQSIFTRAYTYILATCLPDNHCISSIEIYTFHLKVFESWPSFLNCSRGGTRNKRTRFREKGKGTSEVGSFWILLFQMDHSIDTRTRVPISRKRHILGMFHKRGFP